MSAPSRWSQDEFDSLYRSVGDNLAEVPWAALRPHPRLVAWLDSGPARAGSRALVVACGLGDDAAELHRRGWRVTAFDLSPTAISWCRKRFGDAADYRVADLFDLPEAWRERFDLVVEINTIQSLPLDRRRAVIGAIAGTVAPGGTLFLRCLARAEGEPAPRRPWPVSRAELAAFAEEGLAPVSAIEDLGLSGNPCFQLVSTRPSNT